jgi:competence protein ComEC
MRLRLFPLALLFALLSISTPSHAQNKPTDTTKIEKTTDSTVYITKSGKKYHRAGCKFLGKSSIPVKLSDAKKYYQPCKHCKPPE